MFFIKQLYEYKKKTEKVKKIFQQAVFNILNVVLALIKPFIEYNKSNTMLIRRVL